MKDYNSFEKLLKTFKHFSLFLFPRNEFRLKLVTIDYKNEQKKNKKKQINIELIFYLTLIVCSVVLWHMNLYRLFNGKQSVLFQKIQFSISTEFNFQKNILQDIQFIQIVAIHLIQFSISTHFFTLS